MKKKFETSFSISMAADGRKRIRNKRRKKKKKISAIGKIDHYQFE
jgi:hypothetical protein